jgi:SAM-dependent methyltransferase
MEKPSIIEIGPGFGTFSKLAQESEYFSKVSVIERTPSMADACRKRDLHVIESALEDVILDTIEESDVLVCFEVIEHIYNPTDFLIRVAKLLRSGGLFIFTCPNGKGFDTEILQAQSPSVDTEHVNLFNPKSIEILLNNVDFEIVSVETPGRLDVEIVNRAIIENGLEIVDNPFWRSLFGEKYETMGDDFQKLLIKHKMSGNMRIIARKK